MELLTTALLNQLQTTKVLQAIQQ